MKWAKSSVRNNAVIRYTELCPATAVRRPRMNIATIAPTFSIFAQVQLSDTGNIFVEDRMMLTQYSHRIEDEVIARRSKCDLFAGFQDLSNIRPALDRYHILADTLRSGWVFGTNAQLEDDLAELPSRLTRVQLEPEHVLAREWFLLALGDGYSRALISTEITPPGTLDHERRFRGVLTNDPDTIARIVQRTQVALAGANPELVSSSHY